MLRPLHYTPFTARELKPAGWLKKQLEIQAAGLSGHLDQVWPDIRDSRWIGGDKDGWERVPYWLDGFIPLAWLLEDKDLQARAKRYIDAILAQQQEDGWICPCSLEERPNYDVWALFLLCKVLVVYEECSQDPRVEEAVYRALRNLHSHIEVHTLFDWAAARWFECLIPIYWLYERRPEDWLLDLAHALRVEGFDYETLYREWRLEKPQAKWTQLSHVVNLAMSLKAGALYSRLSGEDPSAMAKQAYTRLHRDHGMACGHFTGDECLAGTSPIRGSECCSVVEAMYSYEQLLSITGEAQWGDLAEALAFNALPATLSPDMWSHQFWLLHGQLQPGLAQVGPLHLYGLERGPGLGDSGPLRGVLPDRGGPCHLPARNGLPLPGHADLHRHHGQARAFPLGHPHPRRRDVRRGGWGTGPARRLLHRGAGLERHPAGAGVLHHGDKTGAPPQRPVLRQARPLAVCRGHPGGVDPPGVHAKRGGAEIPLLRL